MVVVNKDDTYKDSNGQDVDYRKDVEILNLVNSIMWVLLHYGGSIIREMTYQEPFMYSPDTGAPNCCRTLFLKKLVCVFPFVVFMRVIYAFATFNYSRTVKSFFRSTIS